MRILTKLGSAVLAVALLAGVASADHYRGGWHGRGAGWRVAPAYAYRYERRPIYVARPYIAERYYDVRVRPRLYVESYPAVEGYAWIRGHWQWNGYEWLWRPGHYQPIY